MAKKRTSLIGSTKKKTYPISTAFGLAKPKKKSEPVTAWGKYIKKEAKKGKHSNGMVF
ncbi:MAG: hypothetical protein J6J42_02500 [Lachnospiraceae bacterium]|nr:hypothetical protein [Lachnospiraceae bacterium]